MSTTSYPNGDIKYSMPVTEAITLAESRRVGWAFLCYSHTWNKTKSVHSHYKKCVGVEQCPKCIYRLRPIMPAHGTKDTIPVPSGANCEFCSSEEVEVPLIYVPCSATMITRTAGDTMHFVHYGIHNHARPVWKSLNGTATQKLRDVVQLNPSITPKELQVGTIARNPIMEMKDCEALNNLSFLAGKRRRILKETRIESTLGGLASLENNLKGDFMVSSSVGGKDGHISIQTPWMKQRASEMTGCMQSDSIHSFVHDSHFTDVNVTFTSAFCPVINRTVPILISIMYGKTKGHYRRHFKALLASLSYRDWDDFQERYEGMTVDFSAAQQQGFELALRERFRIPEDQTIDLAGIVRFCVVHYKRSVLRVANLSAFVPPAKKEEFYKTAVRMTEHGLTLETFDGLEKVLREEYPNLKNWIDWHLHKSRGYLIYPALASRDYSSLTNNTNAQESLGGDFKATCEQTKPSIAEATAHVYHYMKLIETDFGYKRKGGKLRQARNRERKPRKKTRYTNDGRAPDTVKALLAKSTKSKITKTPTSTNRSKRSASCSPSRSRSSSPQSQPPPRRGPGRPIGSKTRVPRIGSGETIVWAKMGIPWSFKYEGMSATNTCAQDTALSACSFLCRFAGFKIPDSVLSTEHGQSLQDALDLVSEGDYDRGRYLWCFEALHLNPTGHYDQFATMESQFYDPLPELFTFRTETHTICSSPYCPKQQSIKAKSRKSVLALYRRHDTQRDLDVFFGSLEKCDVAMTLDQVIASEGQFTERIRETDDSTTEREWYSCSGMRKQERTVFVTLPHMLILDYIQYNFNKEKSKDIPVVTPTKVLRMGGKEYHLAVVIYCNGGHFNCSVFIGGGVLFYDGYPRGKRTRSKWLDPQNPQHSKGYYLAYAWYLPVTPVTEILPDDSMFPELERELEVSAIDVPDQNVPPKPIRSVKKQVPYAEKPTPAKKKARSAKKPVHSIKKPKEGERPVEPILQEKEEKSRESDQPLIQTRTGAIPQLVARTKIPYIRGTYYPIGLCYTAVQRRGNKPRCKTCGIVMVAAEERLVLTVITNASKNWHESHSYHLSQECVRPLPDPHHTDANEFVQTRKKYSLRQ